MRKEDRGTTSARRSTPGSLLSPIYYRRSSFKLLLTHIHMSNEIKNNDREQRAKRLILCQPIHQEASSSSGYVSQSPPTEPIKKAPTNGHDDRSTIPFPPLPFDLPKKIDSSSNNTNRAGSRKSRVYYMYKFLTETYPSLMSSTASPIIILDVAGGKGDLSWYLVNSYDSIQSTVVDPRPTNHGALCKAARFLEQHEEIREERSVEGTNMFQPMAHLLPHLLTQRIKRQSEQRQEGQSCMGKNDVNEEGWRVPSNLRIHVDETLVQTIRHCTNDKTIPSKCTTQWHAYWQKAIRRVESLCPSPLQKLELATSSCRITEAMQALETIITASLIVGFHPDQATEAIVDLATWLQIPYCIVPCCVFPSEFPDRTLVRGEEDVRVRDHKGLIEYLKAKDLKIREGVLEFPLTKTAKNVVLYTLPVDYEVKNSL